MPSAVSLAINQRLVDILTAGHAGKAIVPAVASPVARARPAEAHLVVTQFERRVVLASASVRVVKHRFSSAPRSSAFGELWRLKTPIDWTGGLG